MSNFSVADKPALDVGDTWDLIISSSLLAVVELLHHQSPYRKLQEKLRYAYLQFSSCDAMQTNFQ